MTSRIERMMSLARELASQPDREHTLERVIEAVKELVPHADDVGITLVRRRGGIATPAANGPVPRRSDALQAELDEGPCMDAIWVDRLVVAGDLEHEERWPRWATKVADELGVHSMMCVRLFTQDDTVGAINMFAREHHAFDADDRDQVEAIAAHAASAVVAAGEIDNLQSALATRTVTAQATGLLMSHYNVSSVVAFHLLKRLSSEQNRKLSTIATELIQDHDAAVAALA